MATQTTGLFDPDSIHIDPITQDPMLELNLKDIFETSPNSLIFTPTEEDVIKDPLFILRSPSYYHLQTYLSTGLRLPPTYERFDADFPATALKPLIDLDPEVYTKTREVMVRINTQTTAFQRDAMYKFIVIGNGVVSYSTDIIRYINGKNGIKESLAALVVQAQQAVPGAPTSIDFKRAGQVLAAAFSRVAKTALVRQTECQDLCNDLTMFHGLIVADKIALGQLYDKVISPGPGDGKPPYAQVLQAQLVELRHEAVRLAMEYQIQRDTYKDATIVAATSVIYSTIFPFGTIAAAAVAGVFGKKIVRAQQAYMAAQAALTANSQEQRAISACLDLMSNVWVEMFDVHNAVSKLVTQQRDLAAMWSEMSRDMEDVANRLRTLVSVGPEADPPLVPTLAAFDLNAAEQRWSNVKSVAQDFVTYSPATWVPTAILPPLESSVEPTKPAGTRVASAGAA